MGGGIGGVGPRHGLGVPGVDGGRRFTRILQVARPIAGGLGQFVGAVLHRLGADARGLCRAALRRRQQHDLGLGPTLGLCGRFVRGVFGGEDEQQQRDQEGAERRHMAGDAAFHIVPRQAPGMEEQVRQGAEQTAIEMKQPLDRLPDDVQDRAFVSLGGLAADVAVAALKLGVAVGAARGLRREGVSASADQMRQRIRRGRLKLLRHLCPHTPRTQTAR